MPSINDLTKSEAADWYRYGYEDGIKAAKDTVRDACEQAEKQVTAARDEALMLSIAAIDSYLDRSDSLDEFRAKWEAAKGVYLELRARS